MSAVSALVPCASGEVPMSSVSTLGFAALLGRARRF
jgi:hypothetical protein